MIPNPTLLPTQTSTALPGRKSMRDIRVAKDVINVLVKNWSGIERVVDENRKLRRMTVDVESLRNSGKLKTGEIYMGVRLIDNNIAKDMPPLIAYIAQSPRQAIFKAMSVDTISGQEDVLEREFTRVLRYPQWEFDYIRANDSAELHGFAWFETLYDDAKPGACAINYVGVEDLVFDLGVSDIQESRMVMRRHAITLVTLYELAEENEWDPIIVRRIAERLEERKTESNDQKIGQPAPMNVWKVYFKEGGTVQCAWWCKEVDEEKWLREPRPFVNGVVTQQTMPPDPTQMFAPPAVEFVDETETDYPFDALRYRVTEHKQLSSQQGRAEMDLYKQEAACTIWGGFINTTIRANKTMWAPRDGDPSTAGTAPKQLEVLVKDGAIWDKPMDAFHPPAPDPMVPKALDMLMTQNADDINKNAYTVQNRKDSRKTATEVAAAKDDDAKTDSVSVLMLSVTLKQVYTRAYRIVRSQKLAGRIKFCDGYEHLLEAEYSVSAAGDVDYVERQQIIANMQQDWPVFQATPMAGVFLEEYVRARYPSKADRFIKAMQMGDQSKQVINALSMLLQQAVTDERGQLRPEWQAHAGQLTQIAGMAQQALSAPTMAQAQPAQPQGGADASE